MKTGIRIVWDGTQWSHQKESFTKKGVPNGWTPIRWYGKVVHAAEDLLEREAGALSETMSIVDAFRLASSEVREELRRCGAVGFTEGISDNGKEQQ